MYRNSCGQALNQLVQAILVVTLPVLLCKTLSCDGASNKLTCTASARNAGIISNGAPAVADPTAARFASTAIGIGNSADCLPAENAIALTTTGGTVTGAGVSPAVASLSRRQATLNRSSNSTCAVTLTYTNSTLTAPLTARVSAAATSATFSATLTAAHITMSANAGVSRAEPVLVATMALNQVFEWPTAELTSWQCSLLAHPSS